MSDVTPFPDVPNNDTSFRTVFPEFADKNAYPEPVIGFWAQVGILRLNRNVWGDYYGLGLYLFVAHNLVLAGQSAKAAAGGGDPGVGPGLISNKAVGDVSVGYSYDGLIDKDAGQWNRTTYGQRFWELQQIVGAGPIQIGAGDFPIGRPPFSIGAWSGPPLWTTWYGQT